MTSGALRLRLMRAACLQQYQPGGNDAAGADQRRGTRDFVEGQVANQGGADVAGVWAASEFSVDKLLTRVVALDMSRVARLDCPLLLFNGRHDYNVSSAVAAAWFERVQAPSKTLVWFEHSTHEIMNEEPGKTLVSLVEHALPIAERAEDVPSR